MKTLALERLPGTPPLVADAVAGRARINFGYPLSPEAEAWAARSREEAGVERPRELIVQHLSAAAEADHAPPEVKNNIQALAEPGTLAVVTGQQVGLAGGPLLTLYKALTTVHLARRLEAESGVRTVPLFWMATSDHNLAEAQQLHWITRSNELAGFHEQNRQRNRAPVGSIVLGERAPWLLQRLREDLPETEFSPDILAQLEDAYRPEATFGGAFRRLAHSLLGRFGLVMFDPEDEGIKRATGSFWVQVAREVDERLQRLADRTDTIAQAGYNVQVPIEAGRPAIFVLEEGARRKVVLEGRAIRARSDMILSRDELIRIAKEEPERLSAGVTLRPLLQSWILPASAYVAGPHEMAYWAQMTEAFEPLGLPRPCVIPRASFTLLEGKIRRRLNKLGVEAERFFGDMDALYDELLEEHGDDDGDTVLEQVRDQVMETRSALEALTERPEFGGLENAVDAAYRKIGYQLEKLEGNFRDRLKRQHGDLLKHWEKLRVHLRPEGQPQERVISPHYYLTLYGERLLDTLLESCGDAIGRHGLLDLQEDHG